MATATDGDTQLSTADPANPGTVRDAANSEPRRDETSGLVGTILLTTVWMALATGLFEGLYWLIRQQIGGEMVFMHPGFLWMSPLVQLALFLIPGVVVAAVAWRTRGPESVLFAVTFLSIIAWLNGILLLAPGLNFWAWILLACGLATATGRLFRRYRDRCLLVMRWTVPAMVLLLVGFALVQDVSAWRRDAEAVAALPESAPDAPNVLLVVLDTMRFDALNAVEDGEPTAPNLTRLAEQGVVFESAWSSAPWTLPSQAGMFTGRLPHEFSADWLSQLDAKHPTLAEALSARGWITGGFVANTRYCSRETGLARGFTHYDAYRLSWADFLFCTALGRKFLLSTIPVRMGLYSWPGRKQAAEINRRALDWLDSCDGRPYFAYLNYLDVHDPYVAPAPFQDASLLDLQDRMLMRNWWWAHKEGLPQQRLDLQQAAYMDCVRGLDHNVGRLFEELESRGRLENTLIVITADHGEHFGEHDLYLHGNSLYEPLLHVPLIVIWPGKVPEGGRVDNPVSLRGLPNTVMQMLRPESDPPFPGESWARLAIAGETDEKNVKPVVAEIATQAGFPPCHGRSPVAAGSMQCVRLGNLKYIRNGDSREELYDLGADPHELHNLAYDEAHTKALWRMRKAMYDSLGDQGGE